MKKLPIVALALSICMLVLAACQSSGTLRSDIDEKTGAYTVTADNAGKGSAVGALGGFTIDDGQLLVVSPDLRQGSLQLRLLDASGDVVFDEEASGSTLSTYELEPGEYGIGVTCNADGTTGSVLAVAVERDEFEEQDADLEAILGAL